MHFLGFEAGATRVFAPEQKSADEHSINHLGRSTAPRPALTRFPLRTHRKFCALHRRHVYRPVIPQRAARQHWPPCFRHAHPKTVPGLAVLKLQRTIKCLSCLSQPRRGTTPDLFIAVLLTTRNASTKIHQSVVWCYSHHGETSRASRRSRHARRISEMPITLQASQNVEGSIAVVSRKTRPIGRNIMIRSLSIVL
jgi:hypothetical protein